MVRALPYAVLQEEQILHLNALILLFHSRWKQVMRLKELKVENYRSLRNITFRPGDLTVIVGANGSGKSNLASAIDFLSQAYASGLEYAVMAKGGFENIAFRSIRRTKSAIRFSGDFLMEKSPFVIHGGKNSPRLCRVKHQFAIKTSGQNIGSDYRITEETVEIYIPRHGQGAAEYLDFELQMTIRRQDEDVEIDVPAGVVDRSELDVYISFLKERKRSIASPVQLLWREIGWMFNFRLTGISVHQLSPNTARTPGPPSPLPVLTAYGQNLAAMVDWLKKQHPKRWVRVEASMKQIVPGLESIDVVFSINNLLTLTFKENHSGKAWTAQDVSDGTIQTLAILCLMADPRTSLLLLEEPENSVHPWIVKQLAKEFRSYSKGTQTILTTHSPLILNVVEARDVWVCYKNEGETLVAHLPKLRPEVVSSWEAGESRLFDLFDMGLVSEAMPKGQLS